MKLRMFGARGAIVLANTVIAQAETPRIVVYDDGSQTVRTRVNDAAEKLCRAARANDIFDDYGSQEECVAASVEDAVRVELSDAAIATAVAAKK